MEDLGLKEWEACSRCQSPACLKCRLCQYWFCWQCVGMYLFMSIFGYLHEYTEYPRIGYICDDCKDNVEMHLKMLEGVMSEEEV
jgi:hypothetical protein